MLSVNEVADQVGRNIWSVRALLWRVRALGLMEPLKQHGQRTWWATDVVELIKQNPSVRGFKNIPLQRCVRCTVLIFDTIEAAPEQFHKAFDIDHKAHGDYCPVCAKKESQ